MWNVSVECVGMNNESMLVTCSVSLKSLFFEIFTHFSSKSRPKYKIFTLQNFSCQQLPILPDPSPFSCVITILTIQMELWLIDKYLYSPRPLHRSLFYLVTVWFVSSYLHVPHESSESFFSNIKNPVNQYMVKYSWGWTFYPLCILTATTSLASQVI